MRRHWAQARDRAHIFYLQDRADHLQAQLSDCQHQLRLKDALPAQQAKPPVEEKSAACQQRLEAAPLAQQDEPPVGEPKPKEEAVKRIVATCRKYKRRMFRTALDSMKIKAPQPNTTEVEVETYDDRIKRDLEEAKRTRCIRYYGPKAPTPAIRKLIQANKEQHDNEQWHSGGNARAAAA